MFFETRFGETGAQKVAHHFSAHFCLAKTPSIAIWGQKIKCFMKTQFFPGSLTSAQSIGPLRKKKMPHIAIEKVLTRQK